MTPFRKTSRDHEDRMLLVVRYYSRARLYEKSGDKVRARAARLFAQAYRGGWL